MPDGGEAIEELRIRYLPVGGNRYLVLANGPSQAADVIEWRPSVDFAAELEKLFNEAFGRSRPPTGGPVPARTEALGRELFAALVPGRIRDCVLESLGLVQDARRELRIRFHLPDELGDLPVELIHDDDLGGALALNGVLSIVRTVRGAKPAARRLPSMTDAATQLTIVIVAATPPGRPELALADEVERIKRELAGNVARRWVRFKFLGEAAGGERATLKELEALLGRQKGPLALVLLAHGESDREHRQTCVVLDAEDGTPDPVPADSLAAVLSNSPQLRCVVLNLCTGARVVDGKRLSGIAQAITGKGIPAVVGMSTMVTDQAAARFSGPLLAALSKNDTVDEAVQKGRLQMRNPSSNTAIEWVAPVLCLAEGTSIGQMFTVPDMRTRFHPLEPGAAAARQIYKGEGGYEVLLPGALYCRAVGEWDQVRAATEELLREEAPLEDQPHLERLWAEANVELAVPAVVDLCKALAGGTDPAVPAWSGMPGAVMDAIRSELDAARNLRAGIRAAADEDWPAAVGHLSWFRRRQFRDGGPRLAYAEGRLAQQEERWDAARDAYLRVGDGLPDLDASERAAYARGRAAEDEGRWRRAADTYRELGDHEDSVQRMHYAEGRACEDTDWPAAATAYRNVEDDHRPDVAVRRAYATARVAETDEDFDAVLSLLERHDPAVREGDLGRLRGYAAARTAEAAATASEDEPEDWEKAAALYAGLDPADRDVAARLRYVRGRSAESREDWPAAAETYGEIAGRAELFPDAATRLAAVTGRGAEAAGDWPAAVTAWQAIPDHRYSAERLPFARVCAATQRGDWDGVLEGLPEPSALAPDLRAGVRPLARYAVARQAERTGDWHSAAQAYREAAAGGDIPGPVRDAVHRAAFAEGRDRQDAGNWTGALADYDEARGHTADADEAATRLVALLGSLPWLDGLPLCSRAEDPASAGESPYRALAAAGITPDSSQREVADASFVLVRDRAWSHGVRLAWDGLRRIVGRLEADMMLFPVLDGGGLARAQRALDPDACLDENLALLARRAEADAALCELLAGRRDAAIERWHRQLEADLDATTVAHALAVAWTWGALDAEAKDRHGDALTAWEHAVAFWGRTLADATYWDEWRTERAAVYAYPVPPAQVRAARHALVERLSSRLNGVAERARADGRTDDARRCERLRLALAVEVAAGDEVAAAGGWADGEPLSVPCGPLFVERFDRIRPAVGRLAARLADIPAPGDPADGSSGGPGDDPAVGLRDPALRVRCLFSQLGSSLVLLDHRRAERAVEELNGLHEIPFPELAAGCGQEPHDVDDCPACHEFAERNPAHAGLPHPRVRLLLDAVDLAVRGLFAQAWSAHSDPRRGTASAVQRWQEAIAVAGNAGMAVRTKHEVVRAVVNRCAAAGSYWGSEQTDARLTEAIELVDAVAGLVDNAGSGELTTTQAGLLASRGLWRGCWRYRFEEPSFELGTADLRRAVALDPESVHARDNLAHGLLFWASSLEETAPAEYRFDHLGEALAVVHEGLRRAPDYVAFPAVLRLVLESLDRCCLDRLTRADLGALRASGGDQPDVADQIRLAEQEIEAGRPVNGVRLLIAAARREPAGSDACGRLVAAVDDLSSRGGDAR